MKNFDELFGETKELNDRRLKAFNLLKAKFNDEILPEFAKVLKACDYKIAFFSAYNKIFAEDMFEYEDLESEGSPLQYSFGITKDGEIFSASYEYDGYNSEWELLKDDELKTINNIGVIELARSVKSRTEKYNNKLFQDAVKAEELMK